jgi:hypothetical protein
VNPTMAEWRKVENTVSDGPGQERTETSYVFGAEFDGVFVPAITKSQGYFEHLLDRGRAEQQSQQDAQTSDAGTSSPTSTTQTQSGQQSASGGKTSASKTGSG